MGDVSTSIKYPPGRGGGKHSFLNHFNLRVGKVVMVVQLSIKALSCWGLFMSFFKQVFSVNV